MGISIELSQYEQVVAGPTGQLAIERYPRPIQMTLRCDDPNSMLCVGAQVFADPDGFIACHANAMKAGWLERHAERGRLWICPACSGKR